MIAIPDLFRLPTRKPRRKRMESRTEPKMLSQSSSRKKGSAIIFRVSQADHQAATKKPKKEDSGSDLTDAEEEEQPKKKVRLHPMFHKAAHFTLARNKALQGCKGRTRGGE